VLTNRCKCFDCLRFENFPRTPLFRTSISGSLWGFPSPQPSPLAFPPAQLLSGGQQHTFWRLPVWPRGGGQLADGGWRPGQVTTSAKHKNIGGNK